MRSVRVHAILPAILGIATVLFWAASPAGAAVLHVENFGVDGSGCGSAASPCRSISKAIENASDSDRIVVGPGVYGDLNGDGILPNSSGEEFGGSACTPSGALTAAVCINKSLTVESSVGAGATLINTSNVNLTPLGATVQVVAFKAVFGGRERGFSIAPHPKSHGIHVGRPTSYPEGVEVTGNLVLAGSIMVFGGTSNTLTGNVVIGPVAPYPDLAKVIYLVRGDHDRLTENVAIGSRTLSGFEEDGFKVEGAYHRITRNSAIQTHAAFVLDDYGSTLSENEADRNEYGFVVYPFSGVTMPATELKNNRARNSVWYGFSIFNHDAILTGNVATGNAVQGFALAGGSIVMRHNVSSNNRGGALFSMGGRVDAQLNTFAGNLEAGVYTETDMLNLTRNNIFGNGFGGQGQGDANCGLVNNSGALVDARRNFWGAPTGPGPDPADAICDISPSTTSSVPFAPTPFPVP